MKDNGSIHGTFDHATGKIIPDPTLDRGIVDEVSGRDKAWFDRHPAAKAYIRAYVPGEFMPDEEQAAFASVSGTAAETGVPFKRLATLVRTFHPSLRLRTAIAMSGDSAIPDVFWHEGTAYPVGPDGEVDAPATDADARIRRAIETALHNERLPGGRTTTSTPPGWRSDAPLIRYLHKNGAETWGRHLQSVPLVRLDFVATVEPVAQQLADEARPFDALPWNDFVLDLGTVEPDKLYPDNLDLEPAHVWSQVARFEDGGSWFSVATWAIKSVSGTMLEGTGSFDGLHWADDQPAINIASLACAYLMQTPEHFVEVRNPPSAAGQKNGAGSKKPWTRTDLPTIILMDPKKAPREKGEPLGGTHASPVVHLRRGGWVTLKHERFYRWPWCENFDPVTNPRRYFRKQCWAGSREWKDDAGRIYRVLDAENEPRIG